MMVHGNLDISLIKSSKTAVEVDHAVGFQLKVVDLWSAWVGVHQTPNIPSSYAHGVNGQNERFLLTRGACCPPPHITSLPMPAAKCTVEELCVT